MFEVVGNYVGVDIFEQDGYYYPSINKKIECRTVQGILEFLDNVHSRRAKLRCYDLDMSILAEHVQQTLFIKN